MASGRHRKTRDWMLLWILLAMILPWAGIGADLALTSSQAAFQPAPVSTTQPKTFVHPAPSQPSKPVTKANIATVAQGESLWSLAQKYCGNGNDWQKLASANHIQSQVITIGEKITIAC